MNKRNEQRKRSRLRRAAAGITQAKPPLARPQAVRPQPARPQAARPQAPRPKEEPHGGFGSEAEHLTLKAVNIFEQEGYQDARGSYPSPIFYTSAALAGAHGFNRYASLDFVKRSGRDGEKLSFVSLVSIGAKLGDASKHENMHVVFVRTTIDKSTHTTALYPRFVPLKKFIGFMEDRDQADKQKNPADQQKVEKFFFAMEGDPVLPYKDLAFKFPAKIGVDYLFGESPAVKPARSAPTPDPFDREMSAMLGKVEAEIISQPIMSMPVYAARAQAGRYNL